MKTRGSGGHVINIIITSERANSCLSITLLYFTPTRQACRLPHPLQMHPNHRKTLSGCTEQQLARPNKWRMDPSVPTQPFNNQHSLLRTFTVYHVYSTTPRTSNTNYLLRGTGFYTVMSPRRILIAASDLAAGSARNNLRMRIRRLLPPRIKAL
jgi:hypothetical protein